MFEKNEFLRDIWFSVIKCRPSLKFLQTFITIGNDRTMCQCILSLASQMLILVTPWLSGHSLSIWAPLINKNKLTWTISHNRKTLVTFHHDPPNCHVQGFNFLEFLVNDISTRSLGLVNLQSVPVCKTQKLHFVSRKFYWFNFSNSLILDLVVDSSWIEIQYNFENV